MVLFINLLEKGLTHEINGDGGSIWWAPVCTYAINKTTSFSFQFSCGSFCVFPISIQGVLFFPLIFSPRSSLIDTIMISITVFSNLFGALITITIFSNLFVALTALFFTNHYVGLKSDSEIGQLAVIGELHQPIISSALSLIHQSHNLSQ